MGKVYATADWHGSKLGFKVLEMLGPYDRLYFLGDAADRGKYGADLIEALLKDERVIYLMGNHEDMLHRLILNIYDTNSLAGMNGHWFYNNGGEPTIDGFLEEKKYTREQLEELVVKIQHLPLKETYINKDGKNIILEHAGYTPGIQHRNHDPLWDREHFYDKWDGGANTYIVHGHTPVQYLKFHFGYNGEEPKTKEEKLIGAKWLGNESVDYKPTILRYCDGHKFDIDMCTITDKRIAVLNLDTFEEIYFDEGENN